MHDYLASRHVADDSSRWTDTTFDALSLRAASADALALLVEQVDARLTDDLVRRVYDWNVYVAAYLLAEDIRGERRVAPSTKGSVLAMIGQRLFDPFVFTEQRSADALRLVPDQLAGSYISAVSLDQVLDIARAADIGSDSYRQWLTLFTTDDLDIARQALTDKDGIAGWTSANVLRRLVQPGDEAWLSAFARHPDRVVRWRAVHVMGALRGRGLDALFGALEDDAPDMGNVRYGALRSIVEQASRLERADQRAEVMDRVAGHADRIRDDAQLRSEIKNALVLQRPPHEWLEIAAPVLEKLIAGARSEQEHRSWLELAAQVRQRQAQA